MGDEAGMRGGGAAAPRVLVSASIAYDYVMTFPGSFKDHILPDKVHVLSVSFLVESLRRQRGGCAGNICYTLALLGEPAYLVGAGGSDFADYRAAFERLGVDLSAVLDVPDELTASAFMNSDLDGNQIAAFYPGAGKIAGSFDVRSLARRVEFGLVGPTTPDAMRRHAAEIAEAGAKLVYDPSQQIVALSPDDLRAGIEAAWAVAVSDYELAMIERKTGLSADQIADRVALLVVTYGAEGSELRRCGERIRIPAAPPTRLADPTGGGDAYRAGLLKGLLLGVELPIAGRIAALAATYAIEVHGPQEHAYTPAEFVARFDRAFPDYAGPLTPELFATSAPSPDPSPRIGGGETTPDSIPLPQRWGRGWGGGNPAGW